jgi:hypothetical protein
MNETGPESQHFISNVVYFRSFGEFEVWLSTQPQLHSLNHASTVSVMRRANPFFSETAEYSRYVEPGW